MVDTITVSLGQDLAATPTTRTDLPVITREGVRWTGGRGETPLRVALDFENFGDRPTAPLWAQVQVADFGVFRPWRNLAALRVPSIAPFRRGTVTGIVAALTLRRMGIRSGEAPRLLDLHFVGNINVFYRLRPPVERHMRRSIGLRPGKVNFSAFDVGSGRGDHYTFSLDSCEAGWEVSLARGLEGVSHYIRGTPVPPSRQIVFDQPYQLKVGSVGATIIPPSTAESGRIAIGVERASTGQRATIEFELETSRLDSTCYFI